MIKQGRYFLVILITTLLIEGCMGGLWTGASLFYDRHHVYKKVNDYKLALHAQRLLFHDNILKQEDCYLDLAVFNGEVLLAGHLPSKSLRAEAFRRIKKLKGYKQLYFEVGVGRIAYDEFEDGWITTKIRSKILADSSINPNTIKIVTIDRQVYILGEIKPSQAKQVIEKIKNTSKVRRAVPLFKYYTLKKYRSRSPKRMQPIQKQAAMIRPEPGSG